MADLLPDPSGLAFPSPSVIVSQPPVSAPPGLSPLALSPSARAEAINFATFHREVSGLSHEQYRSLEPHVLRAFRDREAAQRLVEEGSLTGRPQSFSAAPALVEPTLSELHPNITLARRTELLLQSVAEGFDASIGGSIFRTAQEYMGLITATNFQTDRNFDPYKSERIARSKWAGQWQFFENVRSEEELTWVLDRLQKKELSGIEVDYIGGLGTVGGMVGSLLGDPMSYIPLTLGVKSARLASRLASGAEKASDAASYSTSRVIYGGLHGAVKAAAVQAGLSLVDYSVHRQLDPTVEVEKWSDIILLPAVLGGSVGALRGSLRRYSSSVDELDGKFRDLFPSSLSSDYASIRATEAMLERGTSRGRMNDVLRGIEDDLAGFDGGGRPRPVKPLGPGYLDDGRRIIDTEFKPGDLPEVLDDVPLRGPGWLDEPAGVPPASATFDGIRLVDMEFKPGALPLADEPVADIATGKPGWVGAEGRANGNAGAAAVSAIAGSSGPEAAKAAELVANRMVAAGLPIWGMNAITRAAASSFSSFQNIIENLVGSGGLIRMKNKAGIASAVPVETAIQVRWNKPLVDALRGIQDDWRELRMGKPDIRGDGSAVVFNVKTYAKDWWEDTQQLSYEAFRRRVGEAARNGDKDLITDAATPLVEKSAKRYRQVVDEVAEQAKETNLFRDTHQKALAALEESREMNLKGFEKQKKIFDRENQKAGAFQHSNTDAGKATYAEARAKADAAEAKMREYERDLPNLEARIATSIKKYDELMTNGLQVRTGQSYRTRMWMIDKLLGDEENAKKTFVSWLVQRMPLADARKAADHIFSTLTKAEPVYTRGDIDDIFKSVSGPAGAHARTFDIPDELVKDYLETDIEVLLRHHVKDMGAKIEMQRRFGSTDLMEEVGQVSDEARVMMKQVQEQAQAEALLAQTPEDAAAFMARAQQRVDAIQKEMESAVEDIQAMRDRVYGTYGAAADPHTWDNRLIRVAKQFANMTLLGLSGVSAILDLVRPVMTEGLEAAYGAGFKSLVSGSRKEILKMALEDLRFSGDGAELILNLRAASLSDMGDITMHRTSFERGMNKANSWYFVLNGLNQINQLDKHWASLIIQGNMNMKIIERGLVGKAMPDWARARLAGVGIGDVEMKVIAEQLMQHGVQYKSLRLANLNKWTDPEAARLYASALAQMTVRTVPTPGLGDTPNFMSKPVTSMLMQYKSFAVGQLIRTLYSGLQEGSPQFWYGAAAMVGGGIVLNEIRAQLFQGTTTSKKPITTIIADGVERSSVLGYFADANRAVESLSGHRLGLRPEVILNGSNWHPGEPKWKRGEGGKIFDQFAGPVGGQGRNALSVLYDFATLHPTAATWNNARRLVPGQNLPWTDKAFDAITPDLYPKKLSPEEKAAKKDRMDAYKRYVSAQTERDLRASGDIAGADKLRAKAEKKKAQLSAAGE